MTLDTNKINHILAALDLHIEEAEKAKHGPWQYNDTPEPHVRSSSGLSTIAIMITSDSREAKANSLFIAHARTYSPLACQSLKIAIEGLLELAKAYNMEHGKAAISILHSITNRWPSPTE